jgi:heme/copper-type cytochrome/quinol oxidase subunit 4
MRSCFPLTLAEPIVYVFVEHEMSLYACMVPLKVAIPLTVISFITALESQVRTPYTVSFPAIFAFRL